MNYIRITGGYYSKSFSEMQHEKRRAHPPLQATVIHGIISKYWDIIVLRSKSNFLFRLFQAAFGRIKSNNWRKSL